MSRTIVKTEQESALQSKYRPVALKAVAAASMFKSKEAALPPMPPSGPEFGVLPSGFHMPVAVDDAG